MEKIGDWVKNLRNRTFDELVLVCIVAAFFYKEEVIDMLETDT